MKIKSIHRNQWHKKGGKISIIQIALDKVAISIK